MSHIEALIFEHLEWRGFLVKRNTKVGKLGHGGWATELDVVGYHPQSKTIVHYEPSLDAHSWNKRLDRYEKKFKAGRRYIFETLFPRLPKNTPIDQIAVFPSHPEGRDSIAGGRILSVDELLSEIVGSVKAAGIASRNAIPEQYPLLRTIQLSHVGYHGAAKTIRARDQAAGGQQKPAKPPTARF